MFTVVTPETIQLSPGAVLRFPGTWQDYQKLCQLLGDRTSARIKYRPGEILIMSPLPKHGREANVIADVVKVLLDHLARDYEAFTPITMELPEQRGIESDYCFYIDNWAASASSITEALCICNNESLSLPTPSQLSQNQSSLPKVSKMVDLFIPCPPCKINISSALHPGCIILAT